MHICGILVSTRSTRKKSCRLLNFRVPNSFNRWILSSYLARLDFSVLEDINLNLFYISRTLFSFLFLLLSRQRLWDANPYNIIHNIRNTQKMLMPKKILLILKSLSRRKISNKSRLVCVVCMCTCVCVFRFKYKM